MILTKEEYRQFLMADAKAMDINYSSFKERVKAHITNPKWRFIKKLRRAEYYKNSKGLISKLLYAYHYITYKQYGMKLGFTIPMNVLGKGLSLPHYGTIVISKYAKIGDNARIHICVNVGASNGGAPIIGDNCYMGPGAKIFGPITLGNNVKIGANSVVNKSFEEDNIVLAGAPAKIVKRL